MNDYIKKLNITIIAVQPFPIGMAATNRLISYSRGLVELGNSIYVHIVRSTENKKNIINNKISGVFNGIKYIYTSKSTIWPETKFLRFSNLCKGIFQSIRKIMQHNDSDYIFSLTTSYSINLLYYVICKLKNIKFIRVEDEYPIMFINKAKNYSKLYTLLYLKTYFKMFDGMIVITEKLATYYKNKLKKNTRILVSPMTVEPDRFLKCNYTIEEKLPYIAYCGYLGGNKDGVDILIKAFKIFSKEKINYKLYLIGYTKNIDEMNNLKKIVKKMNLDDKVVFTGKISRDKMPKYLNNAKILALARPANKQAEGGFPTKLGEYLSTGNPVVCTRVGDISNYLKDGINAYLAKPNSPEYFAKKMLEVANDYKTAKKVGKQGQNLVYEVFNYKVQAQRISKFLRNFEI